MLPYQAPVQQWSGDMCSWVLLFRLTGLTLGSRYRGPARLHSPILILTSECYGLAQLLPPPGPTPMRPGRHCGPVWLS